MIVTVIGAGRIGGALTECARAVGREVRLVDRERGWEALDAPAGAPIVVAVRNDDLDDVVERVPASRRADLVFVQNGMIRERLAERGLADATRGLLFFAVARRGDPPVPGGPSPFHGRHAAAMVDFFVDLRLPATEVDAPTFAAIELEKLIWNSAFGVLCQAHEATVGEVVERHADELRALAGELSTIGRIALDVDLELEPLCERLQAYSRSIADYRGAVREWRWRNGWFVAQSTALGVPTPTHERLLDRARAWPQ
ncbi:MAG: ketopantoate reductase C-terminal domain-containing protein [Nannocystaceae bacterium]